jgi:tetratricopeptide (TPR) repeat protein
VIGFPAAAALERGHRLANSGYYENASQWLESAAVGFDRTRALLLAGETRHTRWKRDVRRRGAVGADIDSLVLAADNYLRCQCGAPSSRRAWMGLGDVYHGLERIGRERRAEAPFVPEADPWTRVGRPGRIAVGMMRGALAAAPNWSRVQDRLAIILWSYGIDDEARKAVRASARALPLYFRHTYSRRPELPSWFDEEFAEGSWEVLGQVPLFPRTRHLIDLGKLERRNGAHDRAVVALEEALGAKSSPLMRAECIFHLGLALLDVGRVEEGLVHLHEASEHPVFRRSSLGSLSRWAQAAGRDDEALDYLRRLRREEPGNLEYCLEFAQVAGRLQDWPVALESLKWAKLRHPSDPRPYVALVGMYNDAEQFAAASAVVTELKELPGVSAAVVDRLRRDIESARLSR